MLKCLQPIWTTKTETASRVRGHLENLLRVEHLAAMPYTEIGAFMAELRGQDGIAARALELAILTAVRSGEVIGARWDEIDPDARMWTIPGARMKAGREHRVPLSAAAMQIVNTMAAIRDGDYLFPGSKAKRPISGASVLLSCAALSRDGATVHGFRSTFRDWCAQQFPG